MRKFLVAFFVFFAFLPYGLAESDLAEHSKSAILIEVSTGRVLYEKNSDEKLAPASMTKIMSMLLIMEAIESGRLHFDDSVMISKNAASMGGSQIFLQEGETYQVQELLKGIAVASGNDAVVAMAEKVCGSVSEFVKKMNERAQELGLKNTHFVNPHGLDAEGHYSSARDMSIIGRELVKHEKILEFTSIYEDYLKKPDGSSTWLVNTNRLVRFYNGVDGLKTGFTNTAGYCVTTTAKRNHMRILSVVMGAETGDLRTADTTNLLNYGFNGFQVQTILEKNQIVGTMFLPLAKKEFVDAIIPEDVTEVEKVTDQKESYSYDVVFDEVEVPIQKGDKVGTVYIKNSKGTIIQEKNITVLESVEKANIWNLFCRNVKSWL